MSELPVVSQYHKDNPHLPEDYSEGVERRKRERRLNELEMKVAIDERLKSRNCAEECPSMIELRTKYNDIVPAMEKTIERIQASLESTQDSIRAIDAKMNKIVIGVLAGIAIFGMKELWALVSTAVFHIPQ